MKFIQFIVAATLLTAGNHSYSQTIGAEFPKISGENPLDEKVSIPEDTKGKFTLIGMAFSKKSEADLKTWFNPVYSTFIAEPTGVFAGFGYDVHVYFIPMFTGIKAAAANSAKRKAAKEVDHKLKPHVVFYKGSMKAYKETLGLDEKDIPYFFVLDREGKIIYSTSGKYNAHKMREIEALVE